jgi:hypothetical protein
MRRRKLLKIPTCAPCVGRADGEEAGGMPVWWARVEVEEVVEVEGWRDDTLKAINLLEGAGIPL